MKLLYVSLIFPYPINDGGKSGTFRMVEALRNQHEITFIAPESTPSNLEDLQELWPNVTLKTFKCPQAPKPSFFRNLVASRFFTRKVGGFDTKAQWMQASMSLYNTNLIEYYFDNLIDVFEAEILVGNYDLVEVDFIELAPLVHFIPLHIPKVFVHHELRYLRMQREYDTLEQKNPATVWKIENTKTIELAQISLYDKVICLTENDKNILLAEGLEESKLEISPLPMVVNPQEINQPFVSKKRLLFLGPDQHYPNVDGVNFFLENCWEEIQRLNPGVQLSIVGKWADSSKKWFKDFQNVTFEGFVPDLKTIMEGSIMIVPLRIGSGMRMKILEGVSYHVPMVCTSIGAEGLPMHNDVNCKIADSAEDFILATHQLLNDVELQNSFAQKASEILNQGYSTEECVQKREHVFRRTQFLTAKL